MTTSLPPNRLESRFVDKNPPYVRGEALSEANRCLYCYDAPCIQACPTSIDIPTFIRKIATGNPRGSARTILEANLLGASCAKVCPVEVLCEGSCVYVAWGRPAIRIGRLQRYAMDHGASPELLLPRASSTGFRVAHIGGGPASLACAGRLALLGHEVVVYDRGAHPGGLNTTGVAPYKMPAAAALAEVAFVEELGVEIRRGVEVGRDVTSDELLEQYDALFLGPGLGDDSRLGVPGEDGPGVLGAVAWIRAMKTDPNQTVDGIARAAVIGGGNTALDAARELKHLGVADVSLIYRRGESDMSGYRHEWAQAKQEGVALIEHAVVSEIERDGNRVRALKLKRAASGVATREELPGVPVDLVIIAIGQAKLRALAALFPGVATDKRGRIVADEATGVTGNPRIFTGGDARNGGKEVVNAVAEGQVAAAAIDAGLHGGRLSRAGLAPSEKKGA